MTNLLKIKDLRLSFREGKKEIKILTGVDMSINSGEIVAVVGESGSGKTTVAMTIMGLLNDSNMPLTSGEILFEEQNLMAKSDKEMQKIRGRQISMVFQEPLVALNPVMSIGEQIEELLIIHGFTDKDQRRSKTLKAMDDVGLPEPSKFYYYYPSQLSGGLKQRVVIAMAIVCDPKLIIADEPTTALDVTTQRQILSLLKRLKAQNKLSLMLITHDLGVVAEMADSTIVMYCGKVLEQGPTKDIFRKPCHPYTAGLMKCIPYVGQKQDSLYTIPGLVPRPTARPQKGCVFYQRCFMRKNECSEIDPALLSVSECHYTRCPLWEELKNE